MHKGAVLSHPTGLDGGSPWAATASAPPASEGKDEEFGEVEVTEESSQETTEAHAEAISPDAAESEGESAEASPEALAAPPDEESAPFDLVGEGYELGEAQETAAPEADGQLPEVGLTLGGAENAEFLPLLGAFAAKVVPMLTSAAGPALARAVMGKLSPRAKRILARPRPGGDMLSVLQRLLTQATKRREGFEEAGEEAVDEALAEEVAQTAEKIIGSDDRKKITNTTRVPWRYYCALKIEFPSGAVYRGTGFFISSRVVATAGHCVYAHDQGGWARRIEVIPACDGPRRPFKSAFATKFRSTDGWIKNKVAAADYGAIILPANAFPGQKMGSFGFKAFSTPELLAKPVVLAGYPGDKPMELWGMSRKIKRVTASQLVYDIDTMGGQSGAPVYLKHNGKRYVVGIHNYGASTGNSATRVTAAVMANFTKWSLIGAPPSKPGPTGAGAKAAQAAATTEEEEPVDNW